MRVVLERGVAAIGAHEASLAHALVEGLTAIPGVKIYGPKDGRQRTGVVSFTIRGQRVSDVGFRLDEEHGILTRVGLHCAPAAHRTIGTFPQGTVRFSPGPFTTSEEIDAVLKK